jgi:hypothetical protein
MLVSQTKTLPQANAPVTEEPEKVLWIMKRGVDQIVRIVGFRTVVLEMPTVVTAITRPK